MPVILVAGAQWGDEGKGKIVDLLAQDADMVIRFNGGNNAGHTVLNEYGETKLHIYPAGIFNPNTRNIIGPGMFVDLPTFVEESRELKQKGVSVANLLISKKAHLVMPWHIMLDEAEEERRSKLKKIGTTKRGMGPVAADKYARVGLRVEDLLDLDVFRKKFYARYYDVKTILTTVYNYTGKLPFGGTLLDEYEANIAGIIDFIADTEPVVWNALRRDQSIILEGAQAVLLGIDHGTYPFVTSSNCGIAAAAEGSGIPPSKITERIAVVKAYTTRIGAGAFPTRAEPKDDEFLREKGREYGATTGRPRMCGWLDLPLLWYAQQLNDFTKIAVTKLDILSDLESIPVGVGYECPKHKTSKDPSCGFEDAQARYIKHKGWTGDISAIRTRSRLPENARTYISSIEKIMRIPVKWISVGPERDQTIICS